MGGRCVAIESYEDASASVLDESLSSDVSSYAVVGLVTNCGCMQAYRVVMVVVVAYPRRLGHGDSV